MLFKTVITFNRQVQVYIKLKDQIMLNSSQTIVTEVLDNHFNIITLKILMDRNLVEMVEYRQDLITLHIIIEKKYFLFMFVLTIYIKYLK